MDISLAETFLTVRQFSNFAEAAKRLNITQSTVSARIKKLEDLLGQAVFVRGRHGAVTTTAGERFVTAAETMIRSWQRALLDATTAPGTTTRLLIGAPQSLLTHLTRRWLPNAMQAMPYASFMLETMGADRVRGALRDGEMDAAIMFAPPGDSRFERLILSNSKLILCEIRLTSSQDIESLAVRWSGSGRSNLADADLSGARIAFNTASAALDYMLANGGRAYLPDFMIANLRRDGLAVQILIDAPTIPNPVQAVVRSDLEAKYKADLIETFKKSFNENSVQA